MAGSTRELPPDRTGSGKPHYEVLDGLRGSAAVMVVLFHIMGMTVSWADEGQWLHHAALAVDFFFGLSGFVIAFAYDDRWNTMSLGRFVVTRLVRLHPLVILGAVLGLASFLLDPFAANQKLVPLYIVLVDFVLTCLLLPYPALPNRWTDSHSLNSPAWSLLQEYLANLAYALVLRRLGTKALGWLVAAAGMALTAAAWHANSLDLGSAWNSIGVGTSRVAFSFTMGLWLYRIRGRLPVKRMSWLGLTVILLLAFAVPRVPDTVPHGNGLYEAAIVILLFPLLILAGAHSNIGTIEMAVCKFAGHISYPLYILHFPFLFIYMNFVTFRHPPPQVAYLVATAAFVIVMLFAWLALKFYDQPIRAALNAMLRKRRAAKAAVAVSGLDGDAPGPAAS